ncbi:MAG: phosphoenolpyruvate--protein phosphotransferase [Elusimicrobiaceae bacterium]|nr:phosphoenolpyruvate--protein phosphotransferase [Elusimicrobiaceae bacterium]MBT7283184.1 phosphoenolpyruvate--protein phosphotransferase [Elusimicrobiaceae bacterium]
MIVIRGVGASSGIAMGPAYILDAEKMRAHKTKISKTSVKSEVLKFKNAVDLTLKDLDTAEAKALKMLGKEHAKLIETHKMILQDPLIKKDIPNKIIKENVTAEYALLQTLETLDEAFNRIEDTFFKERRHDLFDVCKKLHNHIAKKSEQKFKDITTPVIVIAHTLYPSDTISLQEKKVLGFTTDIGGKTSHTALLAQTMQLPAVVGLLNASGQIKNGEMIIIDGEQGLLIVAPDKKTLDKYKKLRKQYLESEKNLKAIDKLPTITKDGHKIKLMLNIDVSEDLSKIEINADGVGLLRTEFLFMNRNSAPGEEEQKSVYTRVLKHFKNKPVIIRLADLGGDKLCQYAIDKELCVKEDNPFMGLRGIRLFLRYPDMLKTQLRAIYKAAEDKQIKDTNIKIMIPMVSTLAEILETKKIIKEVKNELILTNAKVENIEVGIMVEVPSCALTLDNILGEVDFISIGTNDLIQYILATDRGNPKITDMYDPYNPSVLRIISLIIKTAHQKGKPVAVCGDIATDKNISPLLVGLGIDSLSVTPQTYLKTKQKIRNITFEDCSKVVSQSLLMANPKEIKKFVVENLNENP